MAERDDLSGCGDIHGQSKIVRQRISRAHGQNRECDASIGKHLDDVVDGTVAAAGENGVTSGEHGLTGLFLGMCTGVSEDEAGFDTSLAEHCKRGIQLGLAPIVAATGIGVIKQSCLAHGEDRRWIVL